MTDGVPVLACDRCGRVLFPDRLLCPGCGSAEMTRRLIASGVVEDGTVLRRAPGGVAGTVRLGTVRLDGGPAVVARLEPGATAGGRVRLAYEDGVPVARPARS